MSSAQPRIRFPLLAFSVTVFVVTLFGPLFVPAIATIAPFPIVLTAMVVSLWMAAAMQRQWGRLRTMALWSLSGAVLCAVGAWLIAMLALQISSRINTSVDFSKTLGTTHDYIYSSCLFFGMLGVFAGTQAAWYWAAPPGEEPVKDKKDKKGSKK
jgi:hypothetical protein